MTTPVLLKNLFLYGPAVLSGILLVFCFPTFDLYLIAWVALVPFFVSLYDKTPKEAFKAGFLLGIPYFFGTLYWIYYSINHYGGVSLSGQCRPCRSALSLSQPLSGCLRFFVYDHHQEHKTPGPLHCAGLLGSS